METPPPLHPCPRVEGGNESMNTWNAPMSRALSEKCHVCSTAIHEWTGERKSNLSSFETKSRFIQTANQRNSTFAFYFFLSLKRLFLLSFTKKKRSVHTFKLFYVTRVPLISDSITAARCTRDWTLPRPKMWHSRSSSPRLETPPGWP